MICPFNNRACRCDPAAADKKFHPCALMRRLGAMIRLLGSNTGDEAIAAAHGLRRLVPAEGLSFNEIAVLIENCGGKIEQFKYSDADAEVIFARGVERGRDEERREQSAPPEFYDADGRPRWHEMAVFCRDHTGRLRSDWEKEFVDDMVGKTLQRVPTDKQAKHLFAIFVKVGGPYDAKTAGLYC